MIALLLQNNFNAAKASIAFMNRNILVLRSRGLKHRCRSPRRCGHRQTSYTNSRRSIVWCTRLITVSLCRSSPASIQRLPARSFFWNSLLQVQLKALAGRIDNERPDYVLIDVAAPGGELPYGGEAVGAFNDRLLALLPSYRLFGPDQAGWRVYKRELAL